MSSSWAFVKYVVVASTVTALCAALVGLTQATADAAPYPPSEPCWVTATARGVAADDGTSQYDVAGSGLGSAQPVAVVLADTGQQIGAAQTDSTGHFRTVVTAPTYAGAATPDLTATSPQQSCNSTPPPVTGTPSQTGVPSQPPTTAGPGSGGSGGSGGTGGPAGTGGSGGSGGPGSGGSTGTGGSGGTGGTGGTAGAGNDGSADGAGGAAGQGPTGAGSATGTGTSGPSTTAGDGPTSGSTGSTSPKPPALGNPLPNTNTPFGLGLAIAAILLVLGSLAVLLLTRRPER